METRWLQRVLLNLRRHSPDLARPIAAKPGWPPWAAQESRAPCNWYSPPSHRTNLVDRSTFILTEPSFRPAAPAALSKRCSSSRSSANVHVVPMATMLLPANGSAATSIRASDGRPTHRATARKPGDRVARVSWRAGVDARRGASQRCVMLTLKASWWGRGVQGCRFRDRDHYGMEVFSLVRVLVAHPTLIRERAALVKDAIAPARA